MTWTEIMDKARQLAHSGTFTDDPEKADGTTYLIEGGRKMKLYQLFARHIAGSKANPPYKEYHLEKLDELLDKLPIGSGIDAGSTIAFEECKQDKIVFNSAFHVMDSNGYYDGWIEFKVIVRPSFSGFDLKIEPLQRKRYFDNHVHDYVFDVFCDALDSEIGDDV